LQPLAGRARHDLQAGAERVAFLGQFELRPAAAEQAHEQLGEMPANPLEGLLQPLPRLPTRSRSRRSARIVGENSGRGAEPLCDLAIEPRQRYGGGAQDPAPYPRRCEGAVRGPRSL
jgi:hypothetical protein